MVQKIGHHTLQLAAAHFLPVVSSRTLRLLHVFVVLMQLIAHVEIMAHTFRQLLLEGIHGGGHFFLLSKIDNLRNDSGVWRCESRLSFPFLTKLLNFTFHLYNQYFSLWVWPFRALLLSEKNLCFKQTLPLKWDMLFKYALKNTKPPSQLAGTFMACYQICRQIIVQSQHCSHTCLHWDIYHPCIITQLIYTYLSEKTSSVMEVDF